jgi:D-cysteine desulfhydrase
MRSPLPDHSSIDLANAPTPIERHPWIDQRLAAEVVIKRDDLTGFATSGNKVRKLEYLLSAAVESGCRGVVTCGGLQSNHARATAWAARRVGLEAALLLRAEPGRELGAARSLGNFFLSGVAGALQNICSVEDYRDRRDELMELWASQLAAESGAPWAVIPEGGSNAVGALGYARAALELQARLTEIAWEPEVVVTAMGSGGTAYGLAVGAELLDAPWRVVAVNVSQDAAAFRERLRVIARDHAQRFGDLPGALERIDILDGYVGEGYARSTPRERSLLLEVARATGLLLDPTYNNKAFGALVGEAEAGRPVADRLVFLHSGGGFSLLAHASDFELPGPQRP